MPAEGNASKKGLCAYAYKYRYSESDQFARFGHTSDPGGPAYIVEPVLCFWPASRLTCEVFSWEFLILLFAAGLSPHRGASSTGLELRLEKPEGQYT